jgi:hypothetical protein
MRRFKGCQKNGAKKCERRCTEGVKPGGAKTAPCKLPCKRRCKGGASTARHPTGACWGPARVRHTAQRRPALARAFEGPLGAPAPRVPPPWRRSASQRVRKYARTRGGRGGARVRGARAGGRERGARAGACTGRARGGRPGTRGRCAWCGRARPRPGLHATSRHAGYSAPDQRS